MARDEPTSQALIDEWLAQGNTIKVCNPGERSDEGEVGYTHSWGRKKKAVPEDKTSK
jgi:hypothetical protein|tara:strand:- start:1480 stop:1650 length:171 start_codon:yes stop_codon:yes gene_type:complete